MFEIKTAEKIETVILCYLKGGECTSGKFGKLEKLQRGYKVTSNGITVIAYTVRTGWQVNFKSSTGVDVDLIQAVKIALTKEGVAA